ncbi:unnamed protein product [Amoebophrya sp. A25]|nr:unnamed protein product [Amoebophrya sp. A25]|eukprot:GSA25T00002772001.1
MTSSSASSTIMKPRAHTLMIPPSGFKFVPKPGCFECYDIWCDRCESKDRRIIELEMRNNELVKHITLLQSKLFPMAEKAAGSAAGGGGGR